MYNKTLLLCSVILLSNNLLASSFEEENDTTRKSSYQEGFLEKDEDLFTFKNGHPFIDTRSFNSIHLIGKNKTVNASTIRIKAQSEEERKEGKGALGSGTVIKTDGEAVEAFTAAHVMFDTKNNLYRGGTFRQSQGIYGDNLTYLAEADIEEVCPSKKGRDIAVIRGRYKNDNFEVKELIREAKSPLTECVSKGTIYGYPLGVQEQRVREGFVSCDDQKHQVSTLPGDSGAGLYHGNSVFGVHTGGDRDVIRNDIVIENRESRFYNEYKNNRFERVTQNDYETEFTQCYNVRHQQNGENI